MNIFKALRDTDNAIPKSQKVETTPKQFQTVWQRFGRSLGGCGWGVAGEECADSGVGIVIYLVFWHAGVRNGR